MDPDICFCSSSCVVHVCTFCDILWLEIQSHSGDCHVRATGPRSACALAQAHPTIVHLRLVYLHWIAVNRNLSEELDS